MLEILLAVGTVDAQDDLLDVVPPTFSKDLNDVTRTASSAKVLARSILNSLQARVHGVERRSRDYLLNSVDLPLISQATTSYLIASQFAMPGHTSLESFKQFFNIFCFCPLPVESKVYDDHLRECNRNTADELLGQPEHQTSGIKRNNFLGGRQSNLGALLSTISNLFVFFRVLVAFDMAREDTYS